MGTDRFPPRLRVYWENEIGLLVPAERKGIEIAEEGGHFRVRHGGIPDDVLSVPGAGWPGETGQHVDLRRSGCDITCVMVECSEGRGEEVTAVDIQYREDRHGRIGGGSRVADRECAGAGIAGAEIGGWH